MNISVVLPTYNERENVSRLIPQIEKLLTNSDEIIIVDDNSPDSTAEVAKPVSYTHLTLPTN